MRRQRMEGISGFRTHKPAEGRLKREIARSIHLLKQVAKCRSAEADLTNIT
jgi:hypothetical protein